MEGGEENNEHDLAEEFTSTSENGLSNSRPKVDEEAQIQLRKSIIAIQNDPEITITEKSKKIQELMMENSSWREVSKQFTSSVPSPLNGEPGPEDLRPTYHNEALQILGCQHYQRAAKLQANCCGGWFTCRFCHDESCEHPIVRHDTKKMMCMYCQAVQTPAQACKSCKRTLARYYCDKCKFWDNDPDKNIYHCDSCGICRIGFGLGIDFFHCEKCNCCLELGMKDSHQCIERNLERNCPICGEFLFTSTIRCISLRCSHIMHETCFRDYALTAYQCPICWKSLADMKPYFKTIDAILAQQKMPSDYENYVSLILCNDCEKKSTVKYHFVYHKCPHCEGYNTKVLEWYEKSSESVSPNLASNSNSSSTVNASTNNNGNNNASSSSAPLARQSRVMEVTAMMQGEDGPTDNGNNIEHRSRNSFN